jgi:hypothetical protein
VGREKNGTKRKQKERLPTHNKVTQGLVFDFTQRFGKDVSPVKVGIYFDHLDVSSLNVIFEPVPFEGDMLRSDFGALTTGQNNARSIILIDSRCLKSGCMGDREWMIKWGGYHVMFVLFSNQAANG